MAKKKQPKERGPQPAVGAVVSQDGIITVVGIGASAGGLTALKTFFANVEVDSGLCYVVVVHLSAQHPSHLAELLQPHVKIPVQQVEETTPMEVNRVYVIPPNANLDAIDTHLRLTQPETPKRPRAPVDHFFHTLARTHDGHAVGVILTGTGSDGALGIRAIKERGGLTIVQSPEEAEYDGMPRSAIVTGHVDLVLPLAEIPDAVLKFSQTRPRLRLPDEDDGPPPPPENAERALHRVFDLLQSRTQRDFTRYKRSTILRRIARRMQIRHLEELSAYVELLRADEDEVNLLSQDLLITVTSFFRDPLVFDVLEKEVIPQIFAGKTSRDEVRVWTVGCATGEEAYSIAMLLIEAAERQEARETRPRLQIFASDLHDQALQKAREGFFPGDIDTEVRADRLHRFFQKVDGGFRIKKEVRELVVFAAHNLLGDPPFSRVDLVSCRNLMIYLQRDAQREVAELFHYALRPKGFLVVGTSEVLDRSELFMLADKGACLYQRRDSVGPVGRLPMFPNVPLRESGGIEIRERIWERPSYGELHARMAERFGPPSLMIGPDDQVLHLSEHAGRYLVHPGGEPTANVFQVLRAELRFELRAVLFAARRGKALRSQPVAVSFDGETAEVVLDARPSRDGESQGFVLLLFDELPLPAGASSSEAAGGAESAAHAHTPERELEAELYQLRRRMQTMIEDYESAQEEMKAANEELQSSNEELRSTMEELETSKEELHSMNEELQTLNQENRHKVEELGQLSGDLQNFLGATHIATIFLDRERRILRFTPELAELFSIRPTDRGRPLADLSRRIDYQELTEDITAALTRLVPGEREMRDDQGRWYLTRTQPYRSVEDRIEGVVLTFIDITARKEMEEALRRGEKRLNQEVRAMTRLQELIARLLVSADLRTALDEVLEASIEITGAAMGNVQIVDPVSRKLEIVAQRGFGRLYLEHFSSVSLDQAGDGQPGDSGERTMIEDAQAETSSAALRESAAIGGYRAVQSTPLMSRSHEFLGVLSTHYREPTIPSERELRILDLYARQAADFIEHVRSRAALQDADRRKDEFLAMLGHELRNPLGALRSAVELLGGFTPAADSPDGRHGSSQTTQLVATIERQERQLSRLVDDLLDVGRITQGKIRLRQEVVDLNQAVEGAIETQRAQLETLKQQVVTALPDSGTFVEGDPVRLQQIVGNLVHNASKFSPRKSRIDVRVGRDDGEVFVDVADQGVGLSPSDLTSIFELFVQGDRSLARSEGGLGVGLTMVKRLVEMHGGTITVLSEGANRGSLFRVRLPATAKRPAEQPLAVDAGSGAQPRRVLIVDDNADAAEMLAALLQRTGHECWVARDGMEGLHFFAQHRPDTVLLDLGLPGMDGFEVAHRIRQTRGGDNVLLVALTGYGHEQVIERAAASGFDHHLLKPADPAAIERLLAGAPGPRDTPA